MAPHLGRWGLLWGGVVIGRLRRKRPYGSFSSSDSSDCCFGVRLLGRRLVVDGGSDFFGAFESVRDPEAALWGWSGGTSLMLPRV
ncbi:MAG: hypothetical protein WAM97_20850, partial [Acidimicrobiales bacterium]